jgi:membrane-associated phospholipid phosphatase
MFSGQGFENTLNQIVTHQTGFVQVVANDFAAMPSLHAADSLILGVTMALVVRRPVLKALWLLWPPWVWFSVMATGNHYWVDIVAGLGVAILALAILEAFYRYRTVRSSKKEGGVKGGVPRTADDPAVAFDEAPAVGSGSTRPGG